MVNGWNKCLPVYSQMAVFMQCTENYSDIYVLVINTIKSPNGLGSWKSMQFKRKCSVHTTLYFDGYHDMIHSLYRSTFHQFFGQTETERHPSDFLTIYLHVSQKSLRPSGLQWVTLTNQQSDLTHICSAICWGKPETEWLTSPEFFPNNSGN